MDILQHISRVSPGFADLSNWAEGDSYVSLGPDGDRKIFPKNYSGRRIAHLERAAVPIRTSWVVPMGTLSHMNPPVACGAYMNETEFRQLVSESTEILRTRIAEAREHFDIGALNGTITTLTPICFGGRMLVCRRSRLAS